MIEHGIAAGRKGSIAAGLRTMVAASAWVLAQVGEAREALTRLREGELLLECQAAWRCQGGGAVPGGLWPFRATLTDEGGRGGILERDLAVLKERVGLIQARTAEIERRLGA